jgi:hypothetical protein
MNIIIYQKYSTCVLCLQLLKDVACIGQGSAMSSVAVLREEKNNILDFDDDGVTIIWRYDKYKLMFIILHD